MKQVRWGIIGLGNIALNFAEGLKNAKNARLIAISSQNEKKCELFKNKYKIDDKYSFLNYEELLNCEDVDIVYIALPNSLHHEWVIKSIAKEKNILVEKPATVNFFEIQNIKNNLKDKNIFFSEALMYRYHPQILKIIDLLKKKIIGNLISMESFFGQDALGGKKIFGFRFKKPSTSNRLYNKELGGGAILDLGCYPVSFSALIASIIPGFNYNKIEILNVKKEIGTTGVDMYSFAEINFKNNFKSVVGVSLTKNLGKTSKIIGTEGQLIIKDTWTPKNLSTIQVLGKNEKLIEVKCYENIYIYEIENISQCILDNKKESNFPGVSLNETLENTRILDKWLE